MKKMMRTQSATEICSVFLFTLIVLPKLMSLLVCVCFCVMCCYTVTPSDLQVYNFTQTAASLCTVQYFG